jgi:hypothetical protein
VPADGAARLHLRYWVGFGPAATTEDGLRVHIVDAGGTRLGTLLEVRGSGRKRLPRWRSLDVPLPAGLGGRRVAIEVLAVDAAGDARVEAGFDQVRVTAG